MLLGAQKQTEQLHRIHYSETIFNKVSAKFGILHLVYRPGFTSFPPRMIG